MTDTTATATITDYAADHDLDPADLLAIINTDPDVATYGADPHMRRIALSDGVYGDALYPVDYLADIAESLTDAEQR